MDISKVFIKIGNSEIKREREPIEFTKVKEWDVKLNDINKYSHLFLLACIGDKQLKAERAWKIPMVIGEYLSSYDFQAFETLSKRNLTNIFRKNNLHRFNDKVALEYFNAIKKIRMDYSGKAKQIWLSDLNSSAIVLKLLEFDGIGKKLLVWLLISCTDSLN